MIAIGSRFDFRIRRNNRVDTGKQSGSRAAREADTPRPFTSFTRPANERRGVSFLASIGTALQKHFRHKFQRPPIIISALALHHQQQHRSSGPGERYRRRGARTHGLEAGDGRPRGRPLRQRVMLTVPQARWSTVGSPRKRLCRDAARRGPPVRAWTRRPKGGHS